MTDTKVGPLLIKDFPLDVREEANRAARALDEPLRVWGARAFRNEANRQRGTQVIEPGLARDTAVTLEAVQVAVDALRVMLGDQSGRVPKAAIREAGVTIRDGMRAARGLPPPSRRPRTIQGYRGSDTDLPRGKATVTLIGEAK